uniref:Serine/arginine repetitive matrix protein 2-like n=1 Tax=Petromyzon marinus TaxID=7757 RepID=A0AAJ7T741_PETMA|nr:serine/arginine repetitive matrix protein 2-like [Petromyzon marinus]
MHAEEPPYICIETLTLTQMDTREALPWAPYANICHTEVIRRARRVRDVVVRPPVRPPRQRKRRARSDPAVAAGRVGTPPPQPRSGRRSPVVAASRRTTRTWRRGATASRSRGTRRAASGAPDGAAGSGTPPLSRRGSRLGVGSAEAAVHKPRECGREFHLDEERTEGREDTISWASTPTSFDSEDDADDGKAPGEVDYDPSSILRFLRANFGKRGVDAEATFPDAPGLLAVVRKICRGRDDYGCTEQECYRLKALALKLKKKKYPGILRLPPGAAAPTDT